MPDATLRTQGNDADPARPSQPSADERRTSDAYVVSRINGRIVVTALDNPPRDLGSFAFPASAAAAILADAGEAVGYGPRCADDFLAPLQDRRSATCVTIRRARLESWLGTLKGRWQHDGNGPPRRA